MTEPEILPPISDRPVRNVRPQPQQSRGRAADPDVEVEPIDFLDEETGKPLTRRSRHDGQQNPYDIPAHLRKPGWDYEYKGDRVMNQPVSTSEIVGVREAGWRPVPSKDMLEICPPGWDKQYVERDGMTLHMRPMHLTEEARREDYEHAQGIKASRLQASAIGAQISRDPRMPAGVTKDGLKIQGEVGHHRQAGRDERRAAAK